MRGNKGLLHIFKPFSCHLATISHILIPTLLLALPYITTSLPNLTLRGFHTKGQMLGLLGINTGKVTSSPFLGLFRVAAPPVRFSFQALYLSLAKVLLRPITLVLITAVSFILFDLDFEVVWEDEEDLDNTQFEDPADFDHLNI